MTQRTPQHQEARPKRHQCTALTAAGKPCRNARALGRDVCYFHSGAQKEAGAKGGQSTAARWREVEASCRRLPLLKPANQAKFLVHLIEKEMGKGRRWQALTRYLDLLHRVTLSHGGTGGVIHVVYDGRKPEPDGPEPAPLPSFQEVEG